MRIIVSSALLVVLAIPTTAIAHDKGSIEHKNKYLRTKVTKLYDKSAPGCNLVARKCTKHPRPSYKKIHRYFETMRRMIISKQAASMLQAGRPYQPPAGTATANAPAGGTLENIAACESGGDPTAVSPDGNYKGKYQFDDQTWAGVGGSGSANEATEAEQDMRAAILYSQRGAQPWPVCAN